MFVTDLIRQAEQASDESQAMALSGKAIERTGTVSETVKRQLKALIADTDTAPTGAV